MERTNYGNVIAPVVDDFGSMKTKVILTEDGEPYMVLVPILAFDGFISMSDNLYYWVSKYHF